MSIILVINIGKSLPDSSFWLKNAVDKYERKQARKRTKFIGTRTRRRANTYSAETFSEKDMAGQLNSDDGVLIFLTTEFR